MTKSEELKDLKKEYRKQLKALRKSLLIKLSKKQIAKNNKFVKEFLKFSNSLANCREPATSMEDIKFRGFHYQMTENNFD